MLKLLTLIRAQSVATVALILLLLTIAVLVESTTLLLLSASLLLPVVVARFGSKRGVPPSHEESSSTDNQLCSSQLEDNIHVDNNAQEPDRAVTTEHLQPTPPQPSPSPSDSTDPSPTAPAFEPPTDKQLTDEAEEAEREQADEREPESESRTPEGGQEGHEWLSTRDRADALLRISRIHQQIRPTAVPLSILIGEATTESLSQLSGEALDQAIACKEAIDLTASDFGIEGGQQLFDQLLYCSLSHERSDRIGELLNACTPQLMHCMGVQDAEERSSCLSQLFDQLTSLGEFLPSERGEATALWEQEFVPELAEEVSETGEERVAQALEKIGRERIDTPLVELKEKIEHRPKPKKRSSEERLRNKRVAHARKLIQRHGIHLEQLIGKEESDQERSEQLLNLILSARGEAGEEYSGHMGGTAADLMVESILRIRLQNRICQLYRKHRNLPGHEAIEERVMESLSHEFGTVVISNHRSSIRHHLEWAAGTNSPCSNNILKRNP